MPYQFQEAARQVRTPLGGWTSYMGKCRKNELRYSQDSAVAPPRIQQWKRLVYTTGETVAGDVALTMDTKISHSITRQ